MSSWQRSLHLVLLHLVPLVAANTEIISLSPSRLPTADDLPPELVGNWSTATLSPADNERRWSLEPAALHTPLHQVCERHAGDPFSCPHELWLLLDLDDERWASYSTFTLRLSWPASIPAEFTIATYAPQDVLDRLSERGGGWVSNELELAHGGNAARHHHTSSSSCSTPHLHTHTRSRYARIRVVDAGVVPVLDPGPVGSQPAPSAPPPPPPPAPTPLSGSTPTHDGLTDPRGSPSPKAGAASVVPVPFLVVLEPLYLGLLPATLLPTVAFLVPVVLVAALLLVPSVMAHLEPLARQAREDLDVMRARAAAAAAAASRTRTRTRTRVGKIKDR